MDDRDEKEILRLRSMGLGYKAIAKQTRIPRSTVRDALTRLTGDGPPRRSGSGPAPGDSAPSDPVGQRAPRAPAPAPGTPPSRAMDFDWSGNLDKAGQAMLAAFQKAYNAGEEETAQKWVDRFFKAAQAKFGIIRINQYNQEINVNMLTPELKELIVQDFLERKMFPLMAKHIPEELTRAVAADLERMIAQEGL